MWLFLKKCLQNFLCRTVFTWLITYLGFRIGPSTCLTLVSCTALIILLPDLYSTFSSGKFPSACSVCRTADSTIRTECLTPFLKHGKLTRIFSFYFQRSIGMVQVIFAYNLKKMGQILHNSFFKSTYTWVNFYYSYRTYENTKKLSKSSLLLICECICGT